MFFQIPLRRIVVLACFCLPVQIAFAGRPVAEEKTYTPAQNRNAAYQIRALLPPAPDDWIAGKAGTDWRSDGVSARRSYRPKTGSGRINLIIETRTRGINYKRNLLNNAATAKDRGYAVKKVGENLALIRHTPFRGEMRLWVDDRFLIFLKGQGPLEVFEKIAASVDVEKLKAIK